MKPKLYKILFLTALALFALNTHAQFGLPGGSASITISPKFPNPGEEVTAKLSSLSADLDSSTITWTLDGKTLSSGVGKKEATFKAAKHGSANNLSAEIVTSVGQELEASLVLRPQLADLIVEARSKIPAWYEGASLPTNNSGVKVLAMPNFIVSGSRLNPASLQYEWRINDRLMRDLNGKGKQSINVSGESSSISVKISSQDGTISKEVFASIQSTQPEVLFYETNSLEGIISSQALKTSVIKGGENIEVEAVPFYLSYADSVDLNFAWRFNGNSTEPMPDKPAALIIKSFPESKGQTALVEVIISNAKNLLEKVADSFNVKVE
jgi:hypothetical protein